MRTMNKLAGKMLSCVLKVSVCGIAERKTDKYGIYFKCNQLHLLLECTVGVREEPRTIQLLASHYKEKICLQLKSDLEG